MFPPGSEASSSSFHSLRHLQRTLSKSQAAVSSISHTQSRSPWASMCKSEKPCSSSLCGQTNGRNCGANGSTSTGVNFDTNYIQGAISGPIVWNKFVVGGAMKCRPLSARPQPRPVHFNRLHPLPSPLLSKPLLKCLPQPPCRCSSSFVVVMTTTMTIPSSTAPAPFALSAASTRQSQPTPSASIHPRCHDARQGAHPQPPRPCSPSSFIVVDNCLHDQPSSNSPVPFAVMGQKKSRNSLAENAASSGSRCQPPPLSPLPHLMPIRH
ncbi:hypothetical protein D9615_010621 [Tricholomella constricta]|uniref:Uncharacterized protein n=1 Tax=Tricholomella constricta TaxID=117010 RepID=A0A8H5GL29_9AGAR|nr:hypothetical protein D9615_010621 [Tricholomella constricta]